MSRIRIDFVISRVLAIVVPFALLAYGFDALTATQTFDKKRQLDNAGQVLNGDVLSVPVNSAIHKRMAKSPEMVIIGNSFANTNVQISLLGSKLGMDKGRTTRLSIPNTIGAHWYALLRHRVFRPEYTPPDVIVIVSDLQSALLTEPLSEGSYRNLLTLIDGDDPVIDARVERQSSYLWDTLLENRAKVRRTTINTFRDLAARRVLGPLPRRKLRNTTNDAMDKVFHASKTDLSLRAAALPVNVGDESTQIDLSALPQAADSFLPEIARLCHENGARLIMVRNKESPLMPPKQGDIVPRSIVADVRAEISQWGGLLIEMDPIEMFAAHYDNLDHMTEDGSKRFTLALADALDDLGVSGERDRYVRPLPPDRVDLPEAKQPAAAASIRRSWRHLDANSAATWSWDEAWPGDPNTFRIRVVVEPIDGDSKPVLRVGNHRATFQQLPSGRWVGQLVAPPPTGPWELVLESPGHPLVLEGLEVGTGPTPLYLSGYRPDVHGHRLELLGRVEVFDGELYRDAVRPKLPARSPRLPQAVGTIGKGPGPSAFVDTPKLRKLSDNLTRTYTPLRARCSPVRVLENGEPLPRPNVGCKELREFGKGRVCHTERRVFFTATDGTHPTKNHRDYQVVLDPERRCDGGFWLYPGDVSRLDVPPERLRELRDGVSSITVTIGVADVREEPVAIELAVKVGGRVRLRQTLSQEQLAKPVKLAIDPPIQPDETVSIRLANRGGEVFAVVNRVALLPPPVVWEAF